MHYKELEDKDLYTSDLIKLAKNPNTPQEILNQLANHCHFSIRCGVAWNINVSIETLEKLSNDKNFHVRCRVAENLKTPIKILEKLSNDKNIYVHNIAIGNPNYFEVRSIKW